jgi:hypothetical protein
MNTPPSAEQRLQVSRALCLQALRQPAWLLLVQRVCASPPAHGPGAAPATSLKAELWGRCLTALLAQRQGNTPPAKSPAPPQA